MAEAPKINRIYEAIKGLGLELALLPICNWLKKVTRSSPKARVREMYPINRGKRKFLFSKAPSMVLRYREG